MKNPILIQAMNNNQLKFLTLNVIESCNAACLYCDWWRSKGGEEPFGELADAVNQAASMGATAIRISGGEPLLRPDLASLVAHIRKLGLVSMVCTAAKCEIETILSLLDVGLDVLSISLDNSITNECDDCVLLKHGDWKIEPEITQLVMSGGYRGECCNVKCCYCNAIKMRKASLLKNTFSYIDVLDEIVEFLPNGLRFNPIASEFTVSPHKKEIFEIMKAKDWHCSPCAK